MPFDFTKFKVPGLFSQNVNIAPEVKTEEHAEQFPYRRFGFIQAGLMKGRTEGLRVCLASVYETHMAEIARDENKQEELRKPFRANLQDHLASSESTRAEIKLIETGLIPARKTKIDELKKDIIEIRKNPDHYTGTHVGKAGFYIGVAILFLLSIYLFIFYSSASYSAFFMEFKVDDIIITKAIFDAKAISNALKDGITELIFILTIPFVFIGLGYLIHKFQESKGISKYFKIAALLIITFTFDSIIAYNITEKIHNIKRENDLSGNIPEYSAKLAFVDVGFWLVIFAGFVVYLIWGFVFDFVIQAHAKLDIVKVNIHLKREHILSLEGEIIQLENKMTELCIANEKTNGEINKLRHIIEGTIIQPKAVKEALSQFMVGWYNWLSDGREYNRSEHNKIYEEFIETKLSDIESVINPN